MSGHGTQPAQHRTGQRTGSGLRRWAVVGAVGVFTLGLFGAAANADDGDPGHDGPRAAAPTTDASDATTADTSGGQDTPTPPTGLGTDAELDGLAQQCFDGDLVACDHLFLQSPVGSDYEQYADTCAGRQEAGTESYCGLGPSGTEPIEPTESTEAGGPPDTTEVSSGEPTPPANLGSDPALDALATECYVGDMDACDDLYLQSDEGTEYRTYGDTCAGRQPEFTGRLCTSLENPVPGTDPTGTVPDTSATTVPVVTTPGGIPPATIEPIGLGNDPALDALAQACFAGDMASCDDLYNESEPDTEYRRYGDTCAGRQPEDTGNWCRSAFGDGTPSTNVTIPTTTVPVPLPPVTTPVTVPVIPTVPVPTVAVPTVPVPTSPLPTSPLPTFPTLPVPTVGVPTVPVTTVPTTGGSTLPATTIPGAIPPPTMQPTGLGTDPALDAFAQGCYDGDMAACDELYRQTDAEDDPLYREFADTCAGRQPVGTGQWCEAAFPATGMPTTVPGATIPGVTIPGVTVPTTGSIVSGIPTATQQPAGLGTDPTLDALAQRCYDGDMQACDDLFLQSELGTPYHAYGDTCAGRQSAGTYTYCTVAFPGTQP